MAQFIKFDTKNFNKHTPAGMELLEKSVTEVGIIESITISSDDVIISGNARKEVFDNVMSEAEPIIVETDGTRPVVLKRTDIQSGTKEFHTAAILANTTAKKNINLDIELIQEVAVELYDIELKELGVEIIEIEEPKELTAPHKNEPPTMKLTFISLKQLEQFEIEIKKIIETAEFSNVIYSVSQGEV